jgi:hypothetical protein
MVEIKHFVRLHGLRKGTSCRSNAISPQRQEVHFQIMLGIQSLIQKINPAEFWWIFRELRRSVMKEEQISDHYTTFPTRGTFSKNDIFAHKIGPFNRHIFRIITNSI